MWLDDYKAHCSYRRLRREGLRRFPTNQTIRSIKLYHRQVYSYAYHRPKLDFVRSGSLDDKRAGDTHFAALADFLESIPTTCPHELFRREDDPKARASQASPAWADASRIIVNRKGSGEDCARAARSPLRQFFANSNELADHFYDGSTLGLVCNAPDSAESAASGRSPRQEAVPSRCAPKTARRATRWVDCHKRDPAQALGMPKHIKLFRQGELGRLILGAIRKGEGEPRQFTLLNLLRQIARDDPAGQCVHVLKPPIILPFKSYAVMMPLDPPEMMV